MILGLSAVYQKRIIQPFFKRNLFMRRGGGALGQFLGLFTSYFVKVSSQALAIYWVRFIMCSIV